MGSKSGTSDPPHLVNSSETFADDLASVPVSLQDVNSEDGETTPSSGSFWIPLSRAFRQALPKPAHLPASASTENVGNGQLTSSYPLDPRGVMRTPPQSMGWRQITLPNNYVYFHHSTLRVTTGINLRTPSKLNAVTSYLQERSINENSLPPGGWECWLVDFFVGKNHSPKSIGSGWVGHAERVLTFMSPSLPQFHEIGTDKTLGDRTLASCLAYVAECSKQHRSRPRIPLLDLHGVSPRTCVPSPRRTLRRSGRTNLVIHQSVSIYVVSALWDHPNPFRLSLAIHSTCATTVRPG